MSKRESEFVDVFLATYSASLLVKNNCGPTTEEIERAISLAEDVFFTSVVVRTTRKG
jgi:hypothetical protein